MIIVPVENTLLYIEPVYQTLVNESNLPVLKKVIVASGNKVANIEIKSTENIDDLIDSIIKANDNLSDSLDSNSWDLMGTDIKRLQELIDNLKEQVEEEKEDNENEENTNSQENNTESNDASNENIA